MPTGIYKRSSAQKERLRNMLKTISYKAPKGKRLSVGTEFKKGNIPWNKGRAWPEMSGENHPSRNPKYKAIFEKTWKQTKGIMHGADHPQWKGGKTPLIMKIRNHKKSIEWREKIFKRDNYTCKICGDNKGGNLNAHHYMQVADIIHTLNIKSLEKALSTPILWKLSNGITLCNKCHVIADKASKAIKQLYGGCYE
jgi:hypothetical protein